MEKYALYIVSALDYDFDFNPRDMGYDEVKEVAINIIRKDSLEDILRAVVQ